MTPSSFSLGAESVKVDSGESNASPQAKTPESATASPLPQADLVPGLRSYQQKAYDAFWTAMRSGTRRIGLSAPTGAGKTVVFTAIAKKILIEDSKAKVLLIVNSEELAIQAEASISRAFNDMISIGHERNTPQGVGLRIFTNLYHANISG
jgi:superfamily II DNA or RNA helicase